MTALTRDTFSETLRTKGMESFFEKYDTFPVQYNQIVEKETIDGAYEIKTSIVDAAVPQEREDGAMTHRANMGEGYPVMMRKRFIGDVLEITKGTKQDVAIDLVKRFSGRASRGAIMAKNTMVANLFNNGFYTAGKACFNNTVPNAMSDAAGNLCYDGKPFFNLTGNKRSSKGGSTYYNGETGVTLTSTTLASAIAAMTTRNNKAENDTDIDLIPDILVTGPGAIAQAAKVILESEWIPESGNNAINIMRQALKLVVLNGITDTDFWAIGCSNSGIWAYDGGDPVFDSWYDADKGIYFYKYELEFSCGVKNWRYWYGFNGTTA